VVLAAGTVTTGLVLLQAAILTALTALRSNELGVRAQGSAWASRALYYLHGTVGQLALFPFALFLAVTAAVLLRTGVLPRWLGWVGAALGLLIGVLAVGTVAGLDIGPADQVIFLLVAAWAAVVAFGLGWPLSSAAGQVDSHRANRTT
jgi:Na+/melibiose symporter-like transporter